MATFYMQGCSDENQAIAYFESVYLPVQELLTYDTQMQERMEDLLITEEELDSSYADEDASLEAMLIAQKKLESFVLKSIDKSGEIAVFKGENYLKQSYIRLLEVYVDEMQNRFPRIYAIMEKQEVSEEEMEEFNTLLQENQTALNLALETFYTAAEDYARRHDLELMEDE